MISKQYSDMASMSSALVGAFLMPGRAERIRDDTEQVLSNTFDMQIGRTNYIINVHFKEDRKETYSDKVKRLIINECMNKI